MAHIYHKEHWPEWFRRLFDSLDGHTRSIFMGFLHADAKHNERIQDSLIATINGSRMKFNDSDGIEQQLLAELTALIIETYDKAEWRGDN